MHASPRVVHYIPDEKFTNFFVQLIRRVGGKDHFFAIDPAGPARSLAYTDHANASVVLDPKSPVHSQLMSSLRECRTLVVHFMNPRAQKLVMALPARVRVFWSGWGADYYYMLPSGQARLYSPRTAQLLETLAMSRPPSAAATLRSVAQRAGLAPIRDALRRTRWMRVVSRVDLFSAPIRPDFELLQRALGHKFAAEFCQVNYGSVEETFGPWTTMPMNSRRLLLGNAATPIANHLDAAEAIAPSVRAALTLVVPLSYGDRAYAALLETELTKLGYKNIEVLREFLTLNDYLDKTASCGTTVFNAKRQHALGNIGAALCRGARVFLNPDNPALDYLRGLGAAVESIDQITVEVDPDVNTRAVTNRLALERTWGQKAVDQNALAFLRAVS